MPHATVLRLSLMVALASAVHGFSPPKAYTITTTEDGFNISVKNVQLLRHTTATPMVYVGKVRTQVKDPAGKWQHSDHLQEERLGLTRFVLEELPEVTRLTLSSEKGVEVEVELASSDFNHLSVTWLRVPNGYDRYWVQIPATRDENIYGGGQQLTHFNRRGQVLPIWAKHRDEESHQTAAETSGDGPADDTEGSSFPLPTFVSSRRYYCHVAGSNYMNLDFRHDSYHEVAILGTPDALYFNVQFKMEKLIRAMTYFLWRQPSLPAWVHRGVVMGTTGGTSQMLAQYKDARLAGVQVSGLFIADWTGTIPTSSGARPVWDWIWDTDYYPDLDKEIDRLKEEDNVRVLAYVTPHLDLRGVLYKKAEVKEYLVKNSTGHTYVQQMKGVQYATVDLTNPAAFRWFKDILTHNLIDLGLGGWMADLGEHTPLDAVFHSGADGRLMQNLFPVLWARLNREAVAEAERIGQVVFFMGAGGTGSQKYTLLTSAANFHDDWSYSTGLPSTVAGALSLGMSGIGQIHFDMDRPQSHLAAVGSDTQAPSSNHSEELFLRSAELATFTAVMRTNGGNMSSTAWQLHSNPSSSERFATLTRIYTALTPYRKAVEREHVRGGIPMQRPLFMHYEDDKQTDDIQYQYLFGRDLLVAPVLDKGATSWKVYLPNDGWEHLFNGQELDGPLWTTVQSPIGQPPVFFRRNSRWRKLFIRARNIANGDVGVPETGEDVHEEFCDAKSPNGCE